MHKGEKFKHLFTLNEDLYNGFISLFNDRNPLHTDDKFATTNGFQGRVMHGNILNGFLSFFIGEVLPIKNVIIQTQEIKYLKPVYLNDELRLTVEIEDIFESVSTIEFKFIFENQSKVKVARGKIQIGILK